MLNLLETSSQSPVTTITEVILTDGNLSKRCILLAENRDKESDALTSIAVRSLGKGGERKFSQFRNGLTEQPSADGSCRVFTVHDVGEGKYYNSAPQTDQDEQPKAESKPKGKTKQGKKRPAGKRRG